jgi:uncharacterized protein (DUF58 family)
MSIDPQTLAKIAKLQLRARHAVEGYMAGQHRSPSRGFSIEFAEHRDYVPGDDLRYVDWKALARSDRYYLKQFEDETNLRCWLAVDASQSMGYQGPGAPWSKFACAQTLAAALAWLILHQQDAAGLALFDERLRVVLPPASRPAHQEAIFSALEAARPEGRSALGPALDALAQRLRRRGLVIVLSDCLDALEELLTGLKHLRYRQQDVRLVHLIDPAEWELPFAGWTRFVGLEGLPTVDADPAVIRAAYQEEVKQFCQALRRGCLEQQVDYVRVRTDQPLDEALRWVLTRRRAHQASGTSG